MCPRLILPAAETYRDAGPGDFTTFGYTQPCENENIEQTGNAGQVTTSAALKTRDIIVPMALPRFLSVQVTKA